MDRTDIAKLGEQIAREFAKDASGNAGALLALPFGAPTGDAAASKLADSAFAMVYGRIALARRGHVALGDNALPTLEFDEALARGKAGHARYVLFGAVQVPGASPTLDVKIASVADKSVVWSKSYPVAGADPGKIAVDVEAKVPALDE